MRYIPRGSKGFPKVTKHQRAENFEEQMQKEFRHITYTKMNFALFIFPRISSRKEKKLVTLPFESKKNSSKYQKNFVIPPTFLYIHSLFLPSTTEQFCVLTPPPAPHICTFFLLIPFFATERRSHSLNAVTKSNLKKVFRALRKSCLRK